MHRAQSGPVSEWPAMFPDRYRVLTMFPRPGCRVDEYVDGL